MASTSHPLKILYIAGEGRSGSTILGNVLGDIDGFFFIGEAMNIWRHFLLDNKLCACGVPGTECQIWQQILSTAFDIESIDAIKMERQRRNSVRNRFVWKMFFPATKRKLQNELSDYLNNLAKLYFAISKTTGAEVIIDSSKRPTYAFLLSMIPNIEVYTLHLVRDSRGVAYSWGKKKIQQQSSEKVIYMRQYSPFTSAIRWNISNLLTELLLRKNCKKFFTLKYEDFVAEPTDTLSNILALLNVSPRDFPTDGTNVVHLTTNHAIWGNPSRFQTGFVQLKQDNTWQRKLSPGINRLIKLVTWPGLYRYGYTKI